MAVPGFAPAVTYSVTGVGVSPSIKIISPVYSGMRAGGFVQPALGIAIIGTVTTNVQWSGDDYTAPGYSDATANWFPFTNMQGLSAAASATIGAAMTMVRLNNQGGTSGTATISVCQLGN